MDDSTSGSRSGTTYIEYLNRFQPLAVDSRPGRNIQEGIYAILYAVATPGIFSAGFSVDLMGMKGKEKPVLDLRKKR